MLPIFNSNSIDDDFSPEQDVEIALFCECVACDRMHVGTWSSDEELTPYNLPLCARDEFSPHATA